MKKSGSKKRGRPAKPPLIVSGPLQLPSEILPWERELLEGIGEVDGGTKREEKNLKPEELP